MRERVERLDEFLVHAVHPDGTVPLVGDDDGGRLMRLDGLPTRDARPTLATGGALFGRADMRCVGGDAVEECLWLLGESRRPRPRGDAPSAPAGRSRGFRDGGFYVMRDGWQRDRRWALVDGGPHGSLNCGHAHADALALEVAAGGRPVLIDSGTFSYTGAERDAFRATAAHNTVAVDGESSSLTAGPFHWRHIARTTVHEWMAVAGARFLARLARRLSRGWPIPRPTSAASSFCTDAISSCSTRSSPRGRTSGRCTGTSPRS